MIKIIGAFRNYANPPKQHILFTKIKKKIKKIKKKHGELFFPDKMAHRQALPTFARKQNHHL
jgi:hypothetical protein